MKSFKEKIVQVKAAYDLGEYIENAGISLSQNGVGRMKGLCPFHMEKTPSFIVNENFQSYRCFGCGANGDLISFVEEYEGLSFFESLKKLAEGKGIELEQYNEDSPINYRALKRIVLESAKYFRYHFQKLPIEHRAKQEIISRGLSLDKMNYGYAPETRDGLYRHLKSKGFEDDDILTTGVCRRWEDGGKIVDFWRGRLIFFITDITKNPIGFSARKLSSSDSGGKYINSPDSPIFTKSKTLYNLYFARKPAVQAGSIYVTEGQFDVSAFVEAGIKNVVASSGTAFTEEQAMICRRLVKDSGEIIFSFDGDEAGRKAARKVFEKTPIIHSQAYAIPFPDGKDPCDIREDLGNEMFVKYLHKKKVPLISFLLDGIALDHDLETELGREAYLNEALSLLDNITSSTLREAFLKRIAINSLTPIRLLRDRIVKSGSSNSKSDSEPLVKTQSATTKYSSSDELEEQLLNSFDNDLYSIPYRIIALLIESPELRESYTLEELSSLFPKSLRSTLEALYSHKQPFVIESMPYPSLIRKIVETNFLPMIHIMDTASRERHAEFLISELKEVLMTTFSDKIYGTLVESVSSGDPLLLEKALSVENEKIKKFSTQIGYSS